MESRWLLFLALVVALASINNSAELADNAVGSLPAVTELELPGGLGDLDDYSADYELFVQEGEGNPEAEPVKQVTVGVQEGAAKAPEPTVETLQPKHTKIMTEKFKAANGGKEPDDMEKTEIQRLAVQGAADEINQAQQHKDALEVAEQKKGRLVRRIKRDKETIDKVSQNEEYAARKAYEAADRKVKYLESKSNRRQYEAEEELHKLQKEKQDTEEAFRVRGVAKKEILESKERHVEEQRKVDHDMDAVMKAHTILAKAQSTIESSKDEVVKKTDFLNNIEAHEADARLEYRQAKIQKDFEEDDARKVGLLLKRLTSKKKAIFKFTKSLDEKSKRDFRAAEAGIEKAKDDYAEAKKKYDHYTKLSGKFEKKLKDTQKNIELAKKGVVMGVNSGRDSMAIKSAENYGSLKKKEKKDKMKVDTEDVRAKGQNKMMGAAMAELTKAETLETVARKQSDMVKQHRITMRMQVEKIDFLKNEVRKHKEKAEEADKKAKAAMHKIKNMRKDAIRALREAKARARYATHIDQPLATRARHKAQQILDRDKFNEKAEQDNIMTLQKEAREAYLTARTLKKNRDKTQEKVKKAVDRSRHAKKMMVKAEDKRDEELAHNKKKIKEINDRLNKAEAMFKQANDAVESKPAAAESAEEERDESDERDERDEESELGDSRGRVDDRYEPRRSRREVHSYRSDVADLSAEDEYEHPHRRYERREERYPREHRYRRERRERRHRFHRFRRFHRGRARRHRALGESDELQRYEPELKRHPLELPDKQ